MAFTNGQPPRFYGTLSGAPPRIERNLAIGSGIVPGDFVKITSGAWAIWADSGAIGGIYLGRDPGILTDTGSSIAAIQTPGIDLSGIGIFSGDGANNSTTATLGAVLIISPDIRLEMDTIEGVTVAVGLGGGVTGSTYVSASSGGYGWDVNATTTVDNIFMVDEILVANASTLRGRVVVHGYLESVMIPGG